MPLLLAQVFWGERCCAFLGIALIALGESLRLWAVGHIGSRSRTRGEEVGGLVEGGPFGRVRNPLYLGNGLILLGVGAWGGPAWMGAWAFFAIVQYSLIVRWEEVQLLEQIGPDYAAYLSTVPRWLPTGRLRKESSWSLATAFRSERATLLALAVVSAGFWLT